MNAESLVDAEDTLAIWETPTLTTLDASDAEVGPPPTAEAPSIGS